MCGSRGRPHAAVPACPHAGMPTKDCYGQPTGGEVVRGVLVFVGALTVRGWGQSNLHLQRRPEGCQKEQHQHAS